MKLEQTKHVSYEKHSHWLSSVVGVQMRVEQTKTIFLSLRRDQRNQDHRDFQSRSENKSDDSSTNFLGSSLKIILCSDC